MNRMIRSIHSTLGKALVLSAFALSLLVTSAVAFADQESGGEHQRRRHHDELTFTQIDFPGAPFTAALGINNHSQIVGVYVNAEGGTQHGFLLDEGAFTAIDFPASTSTQSSAINDRGQIVGTFRFRESSDVPHGFLLDDGAFTQIDFPAWPKP
jgi:probable HAF family extracellular repeat protein